MAKHVPLGELLVQEGKITAEELKRCLLIQEESREQLGEILLKKELITEDELLTTLGKQVGLPRVDLQKVEIDEQALLAIDEKLARRYHIFPVQIQHKTITIATSDPFNMTVVDDLFLLTGYDIQLVLATKKEIEWALHHYYLPKEQLEAFVSLKETEGLGHEELGDEQVEHAPTIALVESIISMGIARRASDIHIEPPPGQHWLSRPFASE